MTITELLEVWPLEDHSDLEYGEAMDEGSLPSVCMGKGKAIAVKNIIKLLQNIYSAGDLQSNTELCGASKGVQVSDVIPMAQCREMAEQSPRQRIARC